MAMALAFEKSLRETKELVHLSPTWADVRIEHDQIQDILLDSLDAYDSSSDSP